MDGANGGREYRGEERRRPWAKGGEADDARERETAAKVYPMPHSFLYLR
jgi:hypothetical protein